MHQPLDALLFAATGNYCTIVTLDILVSQPRKKKSGPLPQPENCGFRSQKIPALNSQILSSAVTPDRIANGLPEAGTTPFGGDEGSPSGWFTRQFVIEGSSSRYSTIDFSALWSAAFG